MNKDVIYIEPEDDITDIITKIENSKEKIIALVPPKKAGVFRSVVNIKLIAKSSASAKKTVVLVTTDPSIVRLAAATKLPVTKDLQTAPTIPTAEAEVEATSKEELVEESDGTVETKEDIDELEESKAEKDEGKDEAVAEDASKDEKDEKTADDADEEEEEEERKEKPAKSKKEKSKRSGNKFAIWFAEHKKLAIIGGIGCLLLILGLVWAFAIAPAATVTVAIRTTSNNFSENVSFTTVPSDENAEEGKFYLEERKTETAKAIEFEATGSKNIGEKATGEITVIATVPSEGGSVQVQAGDTFTNGGLKFVADKTVMMSYDGKDDSVCDNADDVSMREFKKQGCKIYAKVKVTAAEAGSQYNISARETGWDTTAPVSAYSTGAMSGGTDNTVTVVQQSDIDKAKAELASTDESNNKEKLLSEIGDDKIVISSSFNQTASEAASTPAVGEEVKDGISPTIKATTVATVYVIDKAKVEEFITKKADLKENQKIYEMKDPFVESFLKSSDGYTGRLKTSYLTGPKLNDSDIVEIVRGKGFGDAQHALKGVDGVAEVTIEGSFPWVKSIPGDTNKITVYLDVKDQDGNKVETKDNDKTEKKNEEKSDEDQESADKDSEKKEE